MQLSDSGVGRCELPYTVLTRGRAPRKGQTSKLTPTGGRHPPVSEPGLRSAVWPDSHSSGPAEPLPRTLRALLFDHHRRRVPQLDERRLRLVQEQVDLSLVVAAHADGHDRELDVVDVVGG